MFLFLHRLFTFLVSRQVLCHYLRDVFILALIALILFPLLSPLHRTRRTTPHPTAACVFFCAQSGLLCYPNCAAGYTGVGPVCWQQCRPGFTDEGALCGKGGSIVPADTSACPWYAKAP